MKKLFQVLAMAALALSATEIQAQVKLRGHYIFNRGSTDTEEQRIENGKVGIGGGLDVILGSVGIGISGYTAGAASEADASPRRFILLGEANYFLTLLPFGITPYIGVHTGLGVFDSSYLKAPYVPRPQDGFRRLGYQLGLRFQPLGPIGVEAQWRRLSRSAAAAQAAALARDQVLLGIILF